MVLWEPLVANSSSWNLLGNSNSGVWDGYKGGWAGLGWAAPVSVVSVSAHPKQAGEAPPFAGVQDPHLIRITKQIHHQWNRKLCHLLQRMRKEGTAHFLNWLFSSFLFFFFSSSFYTEARTRENKVRKLENTGYIFMWWDNVFLEC